ncbi:MAG: amidohydrolase [Ktedonobacteraceae bacterium]|nr:amidohydrolase [Ktedonobacteraceae bacterium]
MNTILYLNGNIYTMDADHPRAQAMAIDSTSGRILAVGTNDEVRSVSRAHTELIDLRGKTVLPGFIDAHIHLLDTAHRAYYIDAGACTSQDEVAALVRARAAQIPTGKWVLGGHWDKNLWPDERFPSKASLDAAAPTHPVALWSKDGHSLWVNSLALERAGITAATPQPPTGAILREGADEPTGVLQEEGATSLVYRVIDRSDPQTNRVLLQRALLELQRCGITTIHDIEGETSLHLFQELHDEGALGVRVNMILPRSMLPQLRTQGLINDDNDLLRVGGIKIFADGTLGSQTAAMLESFEGNPDNYGILTIAEQEMRDIVSDASAMGLTIAIHAIGDRAARVALDAIERAQKLISEQGTPTTSDPRYRLEHVQLIAPEDLQRMRRLGVIASVQPFHAVADRDIAERYWGKRHRRAYAYRSMHDLGIPLALGSDAPVELFDPLPILYAATQRRDPTIVRPPWLPDQALSIADALWGYTLGAAYAGAEEQRKGSLTPGKLGDAVVLREDILNVPQDNIPENGVQATILGGNVVYGEV